MVDVSEKAVTRRIAVAKGSISLATPVLAAILEGQVPKGDVLATARIAAVMAAKRCDDLIPLCHSLPIDSVSIEFSPFEDQHGIEITATAVCTGKTGVEMEAMTAVSVAALTIYDMVKAIQKDAVINSIRLIEKSGGKSGHYKREDSACRDK